MAEYTNNASGDKAISDAYDELNRQAPLHAPESLDAAILAEAHRAVRARPRRVRSRVFRWAPPLALAATVVITATLVILVPQSERQKARESLGPQSNEFVQAAKKEKSDLNFQSTAATADQTQSMDQLPASSMETDELSEIELEIASSEIILPEPASSFATAADRQRTINVFAKTTQSAAESIASARQQASLAPTVPESPSIDSETDTVESANAENQQLLSATTTLSGELEMRQASLAEPVSADSPQTDPKSWRELIEKLLKKEQWDRADKEYQAFKLAHPRHEFIKTYERKIKARDGG